MTALLLLAALLAIAPAAPADGSLDAFLRETLAAARAKHRVPAVAAWVEARGVGAIEAAGVRAEGHADATPFPALAADSLILCSGPARASARSAP